MKITTKNPVVEEVKAAFEREPRINIHHYPISIEFNKGNLVLEGEVEHIIAKKMAVEVAQGLPGVKKVEDRLWVTPAMRMEDGEIADHVRDALFQEPELKKCAIRVKSNGEAIIRESEENNCGSIQVTVTQGVVVLDGEVISLTHKRLVGVLAWWVPGSRNVVNNLVVVPPEEDADHEVTDAVRLALEKDRFINEDQIKVSTRKGEVVLSGLVPDETERAMAEFDAWYVYGVKKVTNNIKVG